MKNSGQEGANQAYGIISRSDQKLDRALTAFPSFAVQKRPICVSFRPWQRKRPLKAQPRPVR